MSSSQESIQLINNPKSLSLGLINRFMQIHKQGRAYAVGDNNVGKRGGSRTKSYQLKGRGKRMKIYAENDEAAMVVGFLALVKPGRDSFNYSINKDSYQGYRQRATNGPKNTKYYNLIHHLG